ncbi:unnamed protein product [Brachionus calyciflorus]|uniref:BRCT domain-containing protein n=1 Tax=Brachionus calyciflorus TaxID=104777 RepID=A0A813Y6S9_9BILA|nr:unnamed protein product [Brachionus calyciflorus]
MNSIKLKKILSLSSEDNTFKAENILNNTGKWIGEKTGDTKQYLTFQLEESTKIKQIDIENESSAFIEILVGKLTDSEDDYEVLLPATSFMLPNESKTSTNTQRLKIFTNETHLDKKLSEKNWEIVKIVCTQPFNTELQFGISSIKFYDKILNENSKDAAKINTGIFSLKKDLSNSENDNNELDSKKNDETKAESLYEKWKREKENKKTEQPETSSGSKRKISLSDEVIDKNESKKSPQKHVPKNQILKGVVFALSGFQNPLRSEIRDTGLKLGAKYRPDWTDDCTHLICAFSNTPKAAQVRKSGGLIVTKEWIFDCKEENKLLDCDDYKFKEYSSDEDDTKPRKAAKNAKKNLSKLNKKDEYDDSYDEEEAENSDDKDFIVSDDEDEQISSFSSTEEEEEEKSSDDSDDSIDRKKKKLKSKKKSSKKSVKNSKNEKRKSKKSDSDSEIDLEEYKKQKEREMLKHKNKEQSKTESKSKKKGIKYDDSDEDDETENKKNVKKLKKNTSSSSAKTDINSDMENDAEKKWELPNFFDDKKFFIHGDFDSKERKSLAKIVYAYGGEVNDYMSDDITYVISDKKWNKEFQESLDENSKLKFIEPVWLEICHRRKKLVPFDIFEINKI